MHKVFLTRVFLQTVARVKRLYLMLCILYGGLIDVPLVFQFANLLPLMDSHANTLVTNEEHNETKHNQSEDVFIKQIAPYSCPNCGPIHQFVYDFFEIRLQKYKIFCKCANIFISLRDKFTTMPKNIIKLFASAWFLIGFCGVHAQQHITISDPQTWTVDELKPYIGQTVIFDVPMYICSAPSNVYVGPRRLFTPTNQVKPGSIEYRNMLTLNNNGSIRLANYAASYPEPQVRTGVKVYNLKATVQADYLEMISGEWQGNLRADLEKGIPDVDINGEHTLLICGMNLEYYLNQQYDASSSMGPDNNTEHQAQRAKVSKALAKINADIYGLVEIQQGDSALKEVAHDLEKNTGRPFRIIHNGTEASGTYTTSAFVYCEDKVKPYGMLQEVRVGVKNRKYMQTFEELATGEKFIFSINHFKAKSGSASGSDANKGDGQGAFNASRMAEAQGVIDKYDAFKAALHDEDILIMGDLNAYAKEDPIIVFLKRGFYDLHRYFHADSSYSYTFGGTAGYLDHAISSASLLGQVTGMAGYNINSDENDRWTYDKSTDRTMFRCSDHDPVIVGLRLDSTVQVDTTVAVSAWDIYYNHAEKFVIRRALDLDGPAYYRVYTINGLLMDQGEIVAEEQEVSRPSYKGLFVILIYTKNETYRFKLINP